MGDSYDELKAQKDAIETKQAKKLARKIMADLDDRSGIMDGVDEPARAEMLAAFVEIILGRKVSA